MSTNPTTSEMCLLMHVAHVGRLHAWRRSAAFQGIVMLAVAVASMSSEVLAQTVTWNGGNTTWTQPDSDSWTSATYNSGNTAVFAGSGTGTVTIVAGGVTPGQVHVTAGSYTFSGGGIGGSGGIAKSGAGTLTLTAANTYSGSTSVTAGVLNIQNATALGGTAAGTTVSSGAALQLQGGITVSGESLSIAGTGVTSDGALRNISGTNEWSGPVSVTLLSAVSGSIGALTHIRSEAGNLIISGPLALPVGATGTGGGILINGNGNGEIRGNITGGNAGVLGLARNATGSGTWTLSGSNTYLGLTAINTNEVIVSGGFAIPDTSLVYFISTGKLTLQASETIGSLTSNATSAVINLNANTLTIGADNSNPVDVTGQTTYQGSIIGTGGIVKVGTGLLTLSGSSSFTGGTTLNAGVLSFANNALGSSGAVTLNSGTLRWASGNTQDISGRLTLVSGSTATLDTNGNNVTLATGFGGSTTAGLTKAGAGTLTLSASNTYTGTTSINAGTLALTGAGALASTGAVNATASGATLDISGITAAGLTIGSLSGSTGSVVTLGGKSLSVGNASSTTFAGGIGGSGGIIKQGSGTLALTAASTYAGSTSVTAGALTIQNATALGGTAAGTTVSSGAALRIQGGITVSGESLSIAGGGISIDGALRNMSGTNTWAGTLSADPLGTVSAGVGSLNRIQSDASSRLVISGPVSIAAGTWNGSAGTAAALILQGDGTGEISGNITGGVAGALTVARATIGSGAWTLSGSNSYLGYTTANINELIVSGGFAIPDTSLIYLAGTGRLTLNASETIGSLTSNSTSSVVNLNANTLTIGADNSTPIDPNSQSAYQGGIIGTGGIVKVGTGRLTLSGSTSYSGSTVVKGGTLALGLNGSLGSSPTITVGDAGSSGAVLDLTAKTGTFSFTSGQTVGGIGTIRMDAGDTARFAGTFAPGNSPGIFTFDGGTALLSGTTQIEILGAARGTGYDAVDLINSATLNYSSGVLALDFGSWLADQQSYQLFGSGSQSIGGTLSSLTLVGTNYTGLTFTKSAGVWSSQGTSPANQTLTFTEATGTLVIVPEPAANALAAIGAAVAAWTTRRMSRRRAPPGLRFGC